jgi:hypothetical protein
VPLLTLVQRHEDLYSTNLIFAITKSIFSLTRDVTLHPILHPELIESGLVWQSVQHCYFDLVSDEYRKDLDNLQTILKDCSRTLKHLVSFADKFVSAGAESF